MKISVVFMLLLTLASCAGRKHTPSVTTESETTTTITPRKVDIPVPGDTSGSVVQLKANPDGKITPSRKIDSYSSKIAAEPIIEIDTNGILKVKCPCLDRNVQATVNDTESVKSKSTSSIEIRYENVLKWWQTALMYCGAASILYFGLKIFFTVVYPLNRRL